jgi:Iap family predicted aminopeptidase
MSIAASILNDALENVSTTRLQRHLDWFATIRRDTGGIGEDAACAYIREQLEDAGVPVHVHRFDAFLSYPIRASLEAAGAIYTAVTHSFAASTGAKGVAAEIVRVDAGRLQDAAGKIALLDGLAMPVTILQASRAGCAGVVFANDDRVIHNMIGTTIWGTPGVDQIDRLPSVPVV